MRRLIPLLLILILLVSAIPALAQYQNMKETNVLTWTGSAWARLTKGQLYNYTTPTAAATMAVGGGYGSTGCTIAATGTISTNGALVVDSSGLITGAFTNTGLANLNGGIAITTNKLTVDSAGNIAGTGTITMNTNKFTVDSSGNALVAGTLTQTGAVTCASTLTAKRSIASDITGATSTMTVAGTPSGSVISCTAATVAVTLPALAAGVTYTFIMAGATSFTLTGPSACVFCDGQTAAKTNLVWSTTPLYLSVSVVSTASNWVVISYTTAPDSSS